MGIKDFNDLGKIEQRPREPVNFVHEHHIHLGGADVA